MGKCWNVDGTEEGGVVGGQQDLDAQLCRFDGITGLFGVTFETSMLLSQMSLRSYQKQQFLSA